jgi:hypothetical protein
MNTAIAWLLCAGFALSADGRDGPSVFRGDLGHSGVFPGNAGDALERVRWSFRHAGGTGDRLPVRATPEGKRWGLPAWWIGGLSVPAEAVSTVLGRDESGRASAWIQRYSAAPGSGFVRLWGRTEPIPDLSWVQAVAEHVE